MEHQQHQNQHQPNGNCGGGSGKGNCHCRPTCPRWTPTTDQVRILKELYYNNGVRSPTAEQIQKISARLRQYGKIEGKNVFYWFQNYKARERLKKKIEGNTNTITTDVSMQRAANTAWKHEEFMEKPLSQNISSGVGVSTPSPTFTVYTVGQLGDHGYGPVIMEKSFRDCSISSGGNFDGPRCQNISWVGIDPHPSSYIYFGVKKSEDDVKEEVEQEDAPDIETLPLFPMHGEDNINSYGRNRRNSSGYYPGWYGSSDDGSSSSSSCASLELTLNSYNGRSSGSM